jgi:hypothetical protein
VFKSISLEIKVLFVSWSLYFILFFQSNHSRWKNVLSNSNILEKNLENHLTNIGVSGVSLNDVFSVSGF